MGRNAAANAPLVTSAGRDHVLLSKQLGIVVVIVISCGLLLFVQSQQAAVQKAMLNSEHVKQQNQMLTKKNEDIAAAKKQLEADEDELTKMYEKWIADDKEDLKLTKEAIAEYRAKVDAVQKSQESNSQVLAHKEVMLSMKEDVLSDLHMQLRAKNSLIKKMKKQITSLGGSLPEKMQQKDDDDWAW